MTDRKSPEYREARRNRRIARKAKKLGITVEEYLARKTQRTSEPQKPDFSKISSREKTLRKLASSALCKRASTASGNSITDRNEAIKIILGTEFPEAGYVEAFFAQK